MKTLETAHGVLELPSFLPDATRAVARAVDSADVEVCGVQAMMINTLHLSSSPGADLIASQGGAHSFMGWKGVLASDSGGFQAFSLASKGARLGVISEDGIAYRVEKTREKQTLTPEKCIRKQLQLGTDILFCLDHCTHPDSPRSEQEIAVENTVRWARQCKSIFAKHLDQRKQHERCPQLFAVVQGGSEPDLRRACAERLLEMGFDGYGFGGWPIAAGGCLVDAVQQVAELIPREFPLHGLGIGRPDNIVYASQRGYALFDCVLPTRDARHGRLYRFTSSPASLSGDFFHTIDIRTEQCARDRRPIEDSCDCLCCRRYTRAYLHHLFSIGEDTGRRLATVHNLRFYARLMEGIRSASREEPE